MMPTDQQTKLRNELLSQLAGPFTGEALFDCLSDLVFFIKNARGEYVLVNETLVERCGLREKRELIGRRADEIFPPPFGQNYRAQDERVLKNGVAIRRQLELHCYPSGARGWCVTHKLPLHDRAGRVVGLVGISKDLQVANERGEDYSRIAKIVQHIQTHFDEPLRVSELAAQAGFSAYQFEQRVQKIFNLTAGQFIQKVRMENAVGRLRETDDAISAIALECGYSDQSAFARQFRQATGMSPAEYRRAFLKPVQ